MFYYGSFVFWNVVKLEAQDNVWSSNFSQIDGEKSTMSSEMKVRLFLFSMLPNHSVTFCVFFHWFRFKIFLKLELILSRNALPSFPDSLLAGLISLHFGLFSKFSLSQILLIYIYSFSTCNWTIGQSHCIIWSYNFSWQSFTVDKHHTLSDTIKNSYEHI